MNTRKLTFLSLLLAATPAIGDVYRTVDANGNTSYSDQPSADAEKIEVRELQTIPALDSEPAERESVAEDREDEGEDGGDGEPSGPPVYERLAISSPADDEAIRADGDSLIVPVSVDVQPGLFGGDLLVLYVDGKESVAGSNTSFNVTGLERGTHQLRAVVRGADGSIRESSPTTTFHLLLHSKLNPAPTVGKPPAPPPKPKPK